MRTEVPVYYDGGKYREGRGLVIEAVRKVRGSEMSIPVQDEVVKLIVQVVRGTLQSAQAIYVPLTEAEAGDRSRRVGRETDLATDRESLEEFPDFINRLTTLR